jgi:hypothetical protein
MKSVLSVATLLLFLAVAVAQAREDAGDVPARRVILGRGFRG